MSLSSRPSHTEFRRRAVRALVVLAAVAVATTAGCTRAVHPSPPAEASVPTSMLPYPSAAFVQGPPISDSAALLAWLDRLRGSRRVLQMPVTVDFGGDKRLSIERAWIGVGADNPPESGMLLRLDDSRMGIALIDHLRTACPPGASTCSVWLEGTWGQDRLLSGSGPAAAPPGHELVVLQFIELADAAATHARVATDG